MAGGRLIYPSRDETIILADSESTNVPAISNALASLTLGKTSGTATPDMKVGPGPPLAVGAGTTDQLLPFQCYPKPPQQGQRAGVPRALTR